MHETGGMNMKIKILEYHKYSNGIVKVQSHKLHNGKYKVNPNYELHKMIISNSQKFPIIYKKEYEVER